MSNPPPPSSTPPPPSTSPTPPTPWWKNPTVLGIAGVIGAAAAVLALFRDTIDFKIGQPSTPPSAASVAPATADNADDYGWGPGREMYSIKEPSPTAVFNSIVDNPSIGDERNYVRCRVAADTHAMYVDEVAVRDATEISVYVWVDNSSTYPDQAITGARMDLVTSSEVSRNPALNVRLEGDNTITVWNGCKILSPTPALLSYIPGSAFLHINDTPPIALKDAVIRGDAPLPGVRGNKDGVIGGNADYYGYIEFRVKALVS
ncbi:hypothetical protein [Nocardia carnea]|uniref:hypothetical protein n=1 Tax=Nocardia carnea TaxID=37328 RepID=UPI0024580090|nr:hypothetical protein [Nocardia carnea]